MYYPFFLLPSFTSFYLSPRHIHAEENETQESKSQGQTFDFIYSFKSGGPFSTLLSSLVTCTSLSKKGLEVFLKVSKYLKLGEVILYFGVQFTFWTNIKKCFIHKIKASKSMCMCVCLFEVMFVYQLILLIYDCICLYFKSWRVNNSTSEKSTQR